MDIERIRAETPGCAEVIHLNNAGARCPPPSVLDDGDRPPRREATDRRLRGRRRRAPTARPRPTPSLRRPDRRRRRRDRLRRERHPGLGHGLPRHPASGPATGSSPPRRVRQQRARLDAGGGAVRHRRSRSCPTTSTARSTSPRSPGCSTSAAYGSSRSPMCRPTAAWSTRSRRSARCAGPRACRSCSTPASRSASSPSTSTRSAATCCRRPAASSCAARAAPASSTCGGSCSSELEPPFVDLRGADWTGPDSYELRPDARRFETWERFVAGQLGLAPRSAYALDLGLDAIEERVVSLAAGCATALAALPGVTVRDRGRRKSGIVTFTHRRRRGRRDRLEPRRAAASTCGSPSRPTATTPVRGPADLGCAPRCTTTTPRTSSTAPSRPSRAY